MPPSINAILKEPCSTPSAESSSSIFTLAYSLGVLATSLSALKDIYKARSPSVSLSLLKSNAGMAFVKLSNSNPLPQVNSTVSLSCLNMVKTGLPVSSIVITERDSKVRFPKLSRLNVAASMFDAHGVCPLPDAPLSPTIRHLSVAMS